MESSPAVGHGKSVVQGRILSLIDHGTIVQMLILTDDGRLCNVHWDHRMFYNMVQSLGCVPGKGERVIIHGEPYEETVEFPDLIEDEP